MPLTATALTNCYVPLPVVVEAENDVDSTTSDGLWKKKKERSAGDGKTSRDCQSLRYLSLDRSVLSTTDGSSLVEMGHTKIMCSVTAATLALADAGVELYDLVSSCQVAVLQTNADSTDNNANASDLLLLDPSEEETQRADGIVTLAMLSNLKEVTFWDQTGRLSDTTSSQALDLCRDGCLAMHKFMRNCLIIPTKHSNHAANTFS